MPQGTPRRLDTSEGQGHELLRRPPPTMAKFEFPTCHACEDLNEYGFLSTDRVAHGQTRNYNKHKKAEDGSNRGDERHHRGLFAFSACEPRVSKIKFVPKQLPPRVREGRHTVIGHDAWRHTSSTATKAGQEG